jgi:hypothetical protein
MCTVGGTSDQASEEYSMNKAKKSGMVILGFSLLCYALPFVSVSCNKQKIYITGVELVTGTQIQGTRVDPQPFAILALLASCLAFAFSFDKRGTGAKVVAILAGVAVALLLALRSQMDSQVVRGGGFLPLEWEPGFWLALICNVAGLVIQLVAPAASADVISSNAPVTPGGTSPPG